MAKMYISGAFDAAANNEIKRKSVIADLRHIAETLLAKNGHTVERGREWLYIEGLRSTGYVGNTLKGLAAQKAALVSATSEKLATAITEAQNFMSDINYG